MDSNADGVRAHWEEVLRQWRASKLSMLAYSRDRWISYWQLRRWRKVLGERKPAPGKVTLIHAGQVSLCGGSGLVVRLRGDVQIEVSRGFDQEVLAQLVRALDSGGARC